MCFRGLYLVRPPPIMIIWRQVRTLHTFKGYTFGWAETSE